MMIIKRLCRNFVSSQSIFVAFFPEHIDHSSCENCEQLASPPPPVSSHNYLTPLNKKKAGARSHIRRAHVVDVPTVSASASRFATPINCPKSDYPKVEAKLGKCKTGQRWFRTSYKRTFWRELPISVSFHVIKIDKAYRVHSLTFYPLPIHYNLLE